MVCLDCLGFKQIFVDEFTVSHKTHTNYNYQRKGVCSAIPLLGRQESISVIVGVSKTKVLHVESVEGTTNSTKFNKFMRKLNEEALKEDESRDQNVVYFMDNARYHTSKATKMELKRLGLNVLVNSPENPCLNMAELFIRSAKAKIKAKRSEVW
jgi:hypothetical protein